MTTSSKKIAILAIAATSLVLLSGCGIETLEFEEKTRQVEHVEEVLESRLESENPEYDLDVTITEDAD
jgi:hypothetical protein